MYKDKIPDHLDLVGYQGKIKRFMLIYPEHIAVIVVTVISGDEVATVFYDNQSVVGQRKYDSCDFTAKRPHDFYNGCYVIFPEEIEALNASTDFDSYARMDYFQDKRRREYNV